MWGQLPHTLFICGQRSSWFSRWSNRDTALNRKGLSLDCRDKLFWVLAKPNHKPRLARVSATYSKRMSSWSLDSVMSCSSLSSSSSSAGFGVFFEAGLLKLPKNGTNTKGYSRPLLLW